MNGIQRVRSALRRTVLFANGTESNSNGTRREDFPILNRHLSSYERFDLSTGHQQSMTNLNSTTGSVNNLPMIESNNEGVEFQPNHNSKRTLRTIPGVFCPIALSMFSISLFMRIGFVLAHAGVLETLLQFGLCFIILFCTLLSVCSLATNGAIEGGGVYHMISRALGPEFGGSIGVLFFFANVIGNGQSVAALVEALVSSFGPGSESFFSRRKSPIKFSFISRPSQCVSRFSLVASSLRDLHQFHQFNYMFIGLIIILNGHIFHIYSC